MSLKIKAKVVSPNPTDTQSDAVFRKYIDLMKTDEDNSMGFVFLSRNYEKLTKEQLTIIIRAFDIAIHPGFSHNREKVIQNVSVKNIYQFITKCIEEQISDGWPKK